MRALLLAAGMGTRLRPYTDDWPKCLMPIKGRPLLEYWLSLLSKSGINKTLINLHYHEDIVREYLDKPFFRDLVDTVSEVKLLGTAGTLRANFDYFRDVTTLLVHSDNLCCCDFSDFLHFHHHERPKDALITMMVFESPTPSTCGIVELDTNGIVLKFHEKVENPPGNLANAAVYLLQPEVLEWIRCHPDTSDFSTEVLPHFLGRIATWKNTGVLRDIGVIEMLRDAQNDNCIRPSWPEDEWDRRFVNNPIHSYIG